MNFIVYAPSPFTFRSAGVRALYMLADELTKRGHLVGMSSLGSQPFPATDCPYDLPKAFELFGVHAHETIAIYPEIVPNNPGNHYNVVRWLLAPQRTSYPNSDVIVAWAGFANAQRLRLDLVERNLFKDLGHERVFRCFYYPPYDYALLATDNLEITSDWPENRASLAALLQTTYELRTWKTYTMLVEEAQACGIPKITFMDTRETRPFWGVWDPSMANDVDNFLELCESRFSIT